MVSVYANRLIAVLCFCAEVLSGASYFFFFDKGNFGKTEIHVGNAPEKYVGINSNFYMAYSLFVFGLISLIFAVAELGLLLFPQFFGFAKSPLLRSLLYILKGIATLGTSADLGIAAGIIEMFAGVVVFLLAALTGNLLSK